ncbi:hypothetical protein B0H19DRAFT_1056987 [Mycena capillaripes]|nr:hypothetical protein B0H19DRAFT_1056987 [Mycena capillaripes]
MDPSADSPEIIYVLQALPTLTSLVYSSGGYEDKFVLFNAMSISDTPNICPGLESLAYGYGYSDSETSDAFFAMVRSRWNPGGSGHLRRLRVFCTSTWPGSDFGSQTIIPGINALQDEGFDAVFMGIHGRGILPGEEFYERAIFWGINVINYSAIFVTELSVCLVKNEQCKTHESPFTRWYWEWGA